MKKWTFFFLMFLILALLSSIVEGRFLTSDDYSSTYQGFLFLSGDNVTIIEGRFDINGSIIVEENATLIFRDAVVTFLQIDDYQFFMTFRNSWDDGPYFIAENVTILTNGFHMNIHFFGNSSASITNLRLDLGEVWVNDDASVNISNSFFSLGVSGQDSSDVDVSNCTFSWIHAVKDSRVSVSNSTISNYTLIGLFSTNYSTTELTPGFFRRWNSKLNSSFVEALNETLLNFTLVDTYVGGWSLRVHETSNATICNSTINTIWSFHSSSINLWNSSITAGFYCYDYSSSFVYDTSIQEVNSDGNSRLRFTNSTCENFNLQDNSNVFLAWYLDVHITDSIGQNVHAANITAIYPNSTMAGTSSTNPDGWARLTLIGNVLNITGNYPFSGYVISATYLTYSNSTTVNMTENQVVTLMFEGYVIPEFTSLWIQTIVVIVLTTIMCYLKRQRKFDHLL